MALSEPSFSVGIEEEYLLIENKSRNLATDPPAELFELCQRELGGQVSPEFLRSQIEVGTRPHNNLSDAAEDLRSLRHRVGQIGAQFDLTPIAASTHPFARWRRQKTTDKARYSELERDLQGVARRMLICGMHVHIGIDDDQMRLDLMNQLVYFTPHLLALSTSSPFWGGQDLGLKSYRLSVFDELPRTGIPDRFETFVDYQRHISILIDAGIIEDGSKIWWDLRPSVRYPTLEMRITDTCTQIEDALCIAALTRCLLRMLYRLRRQNQRWRLYSRMLIEENRWRACRYGFDAGLMDFGRSEIVPFAELLEELIELVGEDADYFNCRAELEHARTILTRGTSAHNQLRVYQESIERGVGPQQAMYDVVDYLMKATLQSC